MNGPEHYAQAERLLAELSNVELNSPREPVLIGEAQVHATLALAAAVAGLEAQKVGGQVATGRTDKIVWRNVGAVKYE